MPTTIHNKVSASTDRDHIVDSKSADTIASTVTAESRSHRRAAAADEPPSPETDIDPAGSRAIAAGWLRELVRAANTASESASRAGAICDAALVSCESPDAGEPGNDRVRTRRSWLANAKTVADTAANYARDVAGLAEHHRGALEATSQARARAELAPTRPQRKELRTTRRGTPATCYARVRTSRRTAPPSRSNWTDLRREPEHRVLPSLAPRRLRRCVILMTADEARHT